MTKTKKKPEPVVQFARFRNPCPSCGHPGASVNVHRGTIHCHACHRTGVWPIPVPAVVRLTDVLRDLIDEYGGDRMSNSTGKTTFGVGFDGEEFVVTVEKSRVEAAA